MSESTQYAQAIARHVKAALLHLRQAEDLAGQAGIDIDGGNDTARLIRAAGEATEDLDLWAANNARSHGAAPADTYPHTERWCYAPGGALPAGSWTAPEVGRGMLAPDAVATYAAMLDATEPDPGRRAELHSELERLTAQRRAGDETARACVCQPGLCSRGEFSDHQGDSPGCMVCADLDPDQPCYAAVRRAAR